MAYTFKQVKICKECGKKFHPRNGVQVYCDGPHVSTCVICGNKFEYSVRPSEKPKTCSRSCQEKLRSKTAQERYGVKNVSQLDSVKAKISERNSSEEVKSKRAATSLARWGVDNPAKHIEVRRKMSEVMSSENYLKNREQTCIDRYGFSSPMQASEVKLKQRTTCLDRYGAVGHPHTVKHIADMMRDGSKVQDYLEFKSDPKQYILTHYSDKPTISQLEKDLGVTNTPIYNILISADCSDMIDRSYSHMEDEVVMYLKQLDPNMQIVRNDRTIIKPLELDIYLPDYRIAIECNPTATHNSSFADYRGGEPKFYKYHQTKSIEANKHGIFLFHIFGYEWVNRRAVIQSMLRNLLGFTSNKVGARECDIVEVDYITCKRFLDENHRQGNVNAKIRLGLKHRKTGEVVSIMTFNKMRNTLGRSSTTDDNTWELSRFCNKLNTSVPGGASKLFKYFVHNYCPKDVVSYSDFAHTRGDMYTKLGFKRDHLSDPGYVWCDLYDNVYFTRVMCQRRNLQRLFNDPDLDVVNQTERQIMEDRQFARVYDSGVIKWVYRSE